MTKVLLSPKRITQTERRGCEALSHPSAGTCGCLRTDAGARSRSGQCLMQVCIPSAAPQSAATPPDSACYAATRAHKEIL